MTNSLTSNERERTMSNHTNTQLSEALDWAVKFFENIDSAGCSRKECERAREVAAIIRSRASVAAPQEDAQTDVDAFWRALANGWEIEPREYFEREAPRNGFGSPLAMAVHYMWKREVKQNAESPVSPSQKVEAASNVEQIEVNAIEARACSSPLLSAETYMFDVRRLLRIHQKYRADLQAVYLRGVSDFHGKIVNALRDLKETYIPTNRALEIIDAAALRIDLPSLKVEEVAAGEQIPEQGDVCVDYERDPQTGEVFTVQKFAATTPVTPSDAARKAAADEVAAWIFKLETPLTSETDLQTTSGIVERIISRYLPVVVEDEIVYVYEAFDNTMQCRRCKEVFKPDMNNRFSVIHSCKSAASAVLKRETPRYED